MNLDTFVCYTWSKRDLSSVLGCDGQTTRLTPLQLSRKCASRRKWGFFVNTFMIDHTGGNDCGVGFESQYRKLPQVVPPNSPCPTPLDPSLKQNFVPPLLYYRVKLV